MMVVVHCNFVLDLLMCLFKLSTSVCGQSVAVTICKAFSILAAPQFLTMLVGHSFPVGITAGPKEIVALMQSGLRNESIMGVL